MNFRKIFLSVFALMLFAGAAMAQDPVPLYPDNYKVVLENERVRVLDFQLRKGAKEDFHAHPAAVTYVLTPFKIRFTFPDGSTRVREAKAGEVFYGDALTHASENIGDTDAHGLLIEMNPAAKSMPSEADLLTAVTFIRGSEGSEQDLLTELLSTTAPTRAEPAISDTISTNRQPTKTISCALRCGAIRKRWKSTKRLRISRHPLSAARTRAG